MTTAVLALQGAFAEHEAMLDALGEPWFELRCGNNLKRPFDRLVLPGGESTTQGRLLRDEGMLEPLKARIEDGMPVLATCAGLILLAKRIVESGASGPEDTHAPRFAQHFATLDVTVERNAYGRQLASFHAHAEFAGLGEVPMSFIRAPRIVEVDGGVEPLARVDGTVVAVREGAQIACAFHPELDGDTRIHELFLGL